MLSFPALAAAAHRPSLGLMQFDLADAVAVLARTPRTLRTLLHGLSDRWLDATDGPDTWSPRVVVAHLLHADRTNWMVRAAVIRAGDGALLPAFDPDSQFADARSIPLAALLDDFERMRAHNLRELGAWQLDTRALHASGEHPALGAVTLSQLLATWTAHDLAHLVQISRTMARQYEEAVGPWCSYLSVMRR